MLLILCYKLYSGQGYSSHMDKYWTLLPWKTGIIEMNWAALNSNHYFLKKKSQCHIFLLLDLVRSEIGPSGEELSVFQVFLVFQLCLSRSLVKTTIIKALQGPLGQQWLINNVLTFAAQIIADPFIKIIYNCSHVFLTTIYDRFLTVMPEYEVLLIRSSKDVNSVSKYQSSL